MALGGNTHTNTLENKHLTTDVIDMYIMCDDSKGVLSTKPYIQTMARCHASPAYRESQIQWLQVIDLWSFELTLHDRELSLKNAAHLSALPADRPLFALVRWVSSFHCTLAAELFVAQYFHYEMQPTHKYY